MSIALKIVVRRVSAQTCGYYPADPTGTVAGKTSEALVVVYHSAKDTIDSEF